MNAYQPGSYLKLRRHHESYNKDELNAIKRLQELNLIKVQDKQKSFLGRKIFYVLTSPGLFYIFSNILNYPPQLLTRYQHDIMIEENFSISKKMNTDSVKNTKDLDYKD